MRPRLVADGVPVPGGRAEPAGYRGSGRHGFRSGGGGFSDDTPASVVFARGVCRAPVPRRRRRPRGERQLQFQRQPRGLDVRLRIVGQWQGIPTAAWRVTNHVAPAAPALASLAAAMEADVG